jgi:hypothetical protein
MKKKFVILVALVGFLGIFNSVSAQERTKIADGIYLVSYGNAAFVIEDDNQQQSINLNVTREKKSNGSYVYNLMCGNKLTKELTKFTLAEGIKSALKSYGGPIGAAISPFVPKISNWIYDEVCDYFSE